MTEKHYSIGEIAKLFNIPASTIRYWEDKELFTTKRNDENDYREFDIQTTIELQDVFFYRNLNVPIQKMKHLSRLSPESIYTILQDTEIQVKKELAELEQKLTGITGRKAQLENLFSLRQDTYQLELLQIEKIVEFDMYSPQDMQVQLAGPTNFVLFKEHPSEPKFKMGLAVTKDYDNNNEELWRNNYQKNTLYFTCLLETSPENIDNHNYSIHEAALKTMGYQVKRIIAPYLATASNKQNQAADYYKAWLEVIPL